jgi:hypothetical protein
MIIKDSTREVHDTFEANRWDLEVNRDPKALYDLILRVIPKGSENVIQNLVIEWNTIKPTTNLADYVKNAIMLRKRFRQLEYNVNNNITIITIMGGLKDINKIWHGQFYYDFQKKELLWANFTARISAKVKQDARKSLNLFRGTSPRPSPNKNDNTSFLNGYPKIWPRSKLIPKVHKKPGFTSIFCAICDFWHQADRPWYDKCNKHHHSNQCPKNQNTEANAPRGN